MAMGPKTNQGSMFTAGAGFSCGLTTTGKVIRRMLRD